MRLNTFPLRACITAAHDVRVYVCMCMAYERETGKGERYHVNICMVYFSREFIFRSAVILDRNDTQAFVSAMRVFADEWRKALWQNKIELKMLL